MSSNPNPKVEDTPAHRLPKQKLTAIARLKSFGGSFMDSGLNRKPVRQATFPPPSWELSDDLIGSSSPPALLESNFEEPPVPVVEPVSFAQRLRGLIEALPLPLPGTLHTSTSTTTSTLTSTSTSNSTQVPSDSENAATKLDDGKHGSPVPPGMDESLVRLLSSEDVMNGNKHPAAPGEGDKHESREGIWNILATLKNKGGAQNQNAPRPGAVEEEEEGVMLYAPLEPKADSELELASSDTVLEYVDEHTNTTDHKAGGSTRRRGSSGSASKERLVEKHFWVPSTTQISLLTTWWGYRLYLPPPVMEKLGEGKPKKCNKIAIALKNFLLH